VRNTEVLQRIEEERKLLKVIKERKRRWLGHVLRGDNVLRTAIEGMVEGKNRRGRRRYKMTDDIDSRVYEVMKRNAQDRESWRVKGRVP
jgi:ribosomal protein L13